MSWLEISALSPPDSAEAVIAILLEAGCQGVAESDRTPGRLTGYLPVESEHTQTAIEVRCKLAGLAEFGLPPISHLEFRSVDEADWANEWRKYFHPVEIGNRLVVKPSWEPYTGSPARVVVEIDPGQAFGTGGHATTRLCLEALDRYVQPGMIVADIGTGSGILAIAAAKLGASVVHATDIDLLPRKVSRENVALNGLEEIVLVHEMDDFDRAARECDLVVANIIAATIVEITPSVLDRLKPGGIFIASGIVDDMLPDVLSALASSGLQLLEAREEDVWRATVAKRAG